MTTKQLLFKKHVLLGRVKLVNRKRWYRAILLIEEDLKVNVIFPSFGSLHEYTPSAVETKIENWTVKMQGIAGTISQRYDFFDAFKEKLKLNIKEKDIFNKSAYEKLWIKLSFTPKTSAFLKHMNIVPDEWGITFYPPKNNNSLFRLFNERIIGTRELPGIFSEEDESLYLKNNQRWTLPSVQERIKLINLMLQLFAGAPLTYRLLIGRKNKEVSCIQINSNINANAYICPSQYNGHASIKKEVIPGFITELTTKIEDIFNSHKKEQSIILLSYFRQLYMAFYDEMKIALCFQIMESLAHYKRIKLKNSLKNKIMKDLSNKFSKKMCPSCYKILRGQLKQETDDFDKYIGKALNTIDIEKTFVVNPSLIKEIMRNYRNQMLHGNFFENMTETKSIIKDLPKTYKNNLPVLLQAVMSIIGVNFVLDLPFDHLTAVKRKMH